MWGLDFHVISIFCLHRAFYKIHSWKLFVYGKIFAHRKIKRGRKSMIKKKNKINNNENKKKTKTGPKKKERVTFCQEKKKDPLLKRPVLAELHAGVQISNKEVAANQNRPYMMLKTRFLFLCASISLDTKTLTIASNRNFESCTSIRCFSP